MLFFEGAFFLFFLVVAVAYRLLRGPRIRTWILLISSYAFYSTWSPKYALLILASTLVDYTIAIWMASAAGRRRKALLAASVAANLGSLAIFKYLGFAVGSANQLFGTAIPLPEFVLPVGISFFTFQSMSYTIDVYRGHLRPKRNFADFAVFVAFFPQLVAGPIVRARDFLTQAPRALVRFPNDVPRAAWLFSLGLFKKVVIADTCGPIADAVFSDPGSFTIGGRFLGGIAFAGQIYGDFSGYTDMALGLALVFGFRFPENFRSPYLALGPQDFWRRWHISLSSWLRDYLYISLGGSRRGPLRTYLALMGTMLLGGLWHGAAWTFVVWGFFHGVLLVAERAIRTWIRPGMSDVVRRLLIPVRWGVFSCFTLVGWMIFRADSLESLCVLFLAEGGDNAVWFNNIEGACLFGMFGIQCASEWVRRRDYEPADWLLSLGVGLLLLGSVIFRPEEQSAFIYFQF